MYNRSDSNMYGLFGRMVAYIGGACALATLYMNSVVPLVIGCTALFCTLSFMNGLGSTTFAGNYR